MFWRKRPNRNGEKVRPITKLTDHVLEKMRPNRNGEKARTITKLSQILFWRRRPNRNGEKAKVVIQWRMMWWMLMAYLWNNEKFALPIINHKNWKQNFNQSSHLKYICYNLFMKKFILRKIWQQKIYFQKPPPLPVCWI